jgi:glutamate racemase
MKVRKILSLSIVFLGLLVSVFLSLSLGGTKGRGSKLPLNSFFQKKRVTIAVTDSGLGGLSVVAEAVRKMKETRVFKQADFVFFNALFSNEGGYNSLTKREEKIRVFSSALESLERRCRPDIILIGCNTLSTLYKDTPFSRKTRIPVIPIVQAGVELIARGLEDHPEASVIIFGTPTTISEGTYPRELEKQGFSPEQIRVQSCPELESFIENDPRSDETEMLISGCVSEAIQKIPSPRPPLLVSLNCTHYGYSFSFWEKAFEEAGITPLAVLNPNPRLTDVLFDPKFVGRYQKTEVTARVVSMVEISRQKIDSLATWLERVSPETAEALRRYEHRPSLFEWKRHIAR